MRKRELRQSDEEADGLGLAQELGARFAREFSQTVTEYLKAGELSRKDAEEKARKKLSGYEALTGGHDWDLWWHELAKLYAVDPEGGRAEWGRIRERARIELESGHRAAKVLAAGYDFGPMDRARFFEVRQALRDEWQPRPGSESFLIDSLAQLQSLMEHWLERHVQELLGRAMYFKGEDDRAGEGTYLPLRLSESESMAYSIGMVDRLQRMYLRTLRSLRDLRRVAPQVFVQNAEQVNVADKQINLKQGAGQSRGKGERVPPEASGKVTRAAELELSTQ